jgi:selenocysteine-specific elongation factor
MKRPCIIGTAGHIDHGKTLLIKMLTGTDTDRLKEERERGISIELGFASLTTPSGIRCGVIDVPGHERFIRNMLAGAGGIDVILLVIAADEGVMPQTREHLDIVDLLGAHDGVVALTKIDLVEPDWRDLVLEEVRGYLAGTCLAKAPIVPVSAVTGEGKAELMAALDRAVAAADRTPRGKFTRLPIDRVFTMQGFGTVVTGTLWAGSLHEGDRLRIEPGGHETRIKSLEVHGARVAEAMAGQRVAVSLHSVPREEIQRGDWLFAGQAPPATRILQARLGCVKGSPYPIKNRMRIRFYLGASEVLGRVVPLETEEMKPGEEGFVELRMEGPVLAERGDRFVLRSYSPMRTIGGGVVLDVSGTHRRRFRPDDIDALRLTEEGSPEERIAGEIAAAGAMGIPLDELEKRLGQTKADVAAALGTALDGGSVRRMGRNLLVGQTAIDAAGSRMKSILVEHQERQPLSWGLLKSELKSRLDRQVHPDLVDAWIQEREAAGELHVRDDRLRFGEDRLTLSPVHAAVRAKILADLDGRGFAAPTLKEMLESIGSPPGAEEILAHLLREGEIVRIPPDLLFPARKIAEMRTRVREYFTRQQEMSVASLKEILGVSRKQAVPLLEWTDRQRWTERRGDVRTAGKQLSENIP